MIHMIDNETYNKMQFRKRVLAVLLGITIGTSGGILVNDILVKEGNKLVYEVNDDNENEIVDGTISYRSLKHYKLITIIDEFGNKHYFIGDEHFYKLYDLKTDMKYDLPASKIEIEKEDISDYLFLLDNYKYQYNSEDMNYIIDESIKIKTLKKD